MRIRVSVVIVHKKFLSCQEFISYTYRSVGVQVVAQDREDHVAVFFARKIGTIFLFLVRTRTWCAAVVCHVSVPVRGATARCHVLYRFEVSLSVFSLRRASTVAPSLSHALVVWPTCVVQVCGVVVFRSIDRYREGERRRCRMTWRHNANNDLIHNIIHKIFCHLLLS